MVWIAAAVALVVAVIVVIGIATGWGSGASPAPGGTSPDPTSSGSAPAPSASASSTTDPDDDDEGDTETAAPRETAPPVGLDEPAEPADGLRVSLASIESFTGSVSVPGEVAGPALQVTVEVENKGKSAALTDTLIVNVYYGPDRTPANILVRPRTDLPLSVPAGKTAEGVYAFSVPENARGQILVEVDLSVDLPVVLFEGAVS